MRPGDVVDGEENGDLEDDQVDRETSLGWPDLENQAGIARCHDPKDREQEAPRDREVLARMRERAPVALPYRFRRQRFENIRGPLGEIARQRPGRSNFRLCRKYLRPSNDSIVNTPRGVLPSFGVFSRTRRTGP